jgi:hypothetical protein
MGFSWSRSFSIITRPEGEEQVAASTHRFHKPWIAGIIFELLSNAGHMDVDGPLITIKAPR